MVVGRVPLLKTLLRRGRDSSICKKVKVSLFTFNFCFVNCCNTSQLMLLTGSRLLKLLKTTKCTSTRIFVYLFLFNFLLLTKTIPTSSNILGILDLEPKKFSMHHWSPPSGHQVAACVPPPAEHADDLGRGLGRGWRSSCDYLHCSNCFSLLKK